MTEVTDEAKQRACDLWDKDAGYRFDISDVSPGVGLYGHATYIQQVSDAIKACYPGSQLPDDLAQFVLPDAEAKFLLEAQKILAAHYESIGSKDLALDALNGVHDNSTPILVLITTLKSREQSQ